MGLRLILYLILIFLLYRLFKAVAGGLASVKGSRSVSHGAKGPPGVTRVDDELVKDPTCGIYVAKREAVKARIGGREYHFCSESCKKRFLASKK